MSKSSDLTKIVNYKASTPLYKFTKIFRKNKGKSLRRAEMIYSALSHLVTSVKEKEQPSREIL